MLLLVCDAAGQTTDVFFVAGQSNASGRVTILQGQNGDFAPLAPSANDALVQNYYNSDGPAGNQNQNSNGNFVSLAPLPKTGYYGAEISAGRELVNLGYNVAIIKITEGGTSLSNDWNSRDTDPDRAALWRLWASEVDDALGQLPGNVRLRGFLWLQGESDSGPNSPGQANNYEGRFSALVDDIYGVLGTGSSNAVIPPGAINGLGYDTSELVFVTALIHPRVSPEDLAAGVDFGNPNRVVVRDAQKAVSSGLNRTYFDTVNLDPNDSTTTGQNNAADGALGLQDDGTHFNAVANEQIGLKFAEAIGPIEPTSVIPDNFVPIRGIFVDGKLANLNASDDLYLRYQPGFTLNSLESPVWLEFAGSAPAGANSDATSITAAIESGLNTPGITNQIEAFNYATGSYDFIGEFEETFTDSVRSINLPKPANYIHATSGQLQLRVGWRQTGFLILFPYTVRVDHVEWAVTGI